MIGGIFENCIGSRDVEASLKYWAELGYRVVSQAQLEATQAKLLYGYESNLKSFRLQNGNSSQHGLIRLMLWAEPLNEGLGTTKPLVVGSRWFASLTKDIYTVADAFTDDKSEGGNWIFTEPVRAIEGVGNPGKSLHERFVGVREMFVIGTETRQAFFQRYNYNRPGYGTVETSSPLAVSEGTHSSLVIADHSLSYFYTEVFGLTPMEFNPKRSGYQNPSTRQILMLEEQQEFYVSAFCPPKAVAGVLQVYTPLYPTPDKREYSKPGSLGLCLFTYQVDNITAFHELCSRSSATKVTPILNNEFGEPSFGLAVPDGTYWIIIGQQ